MEGAMQHAPQPVRQVMNEAMTRGQQRKPSRNVELKAGCMRSQSSASI